MVVTNKGQKYVIEKDDSEDERLKHTFVSLKIKTKGKRFGKNHSFTFTGGV